MFFLKCFVKICIYLNVMIVSIIIVAVLLCVSFVWFNRRRPCEKLALSVTDKAGAQAENAVASALRNSCNIDKRNYRIFQNVYIPIEKKGAYTEIDVLLLHESGFYVFESKNIYGKLYGYLDSPEWFYYSDGKKRSFENPIKQNQSHTHRLQKFLGLDDDYFKAFNIVVFGKNTEIKKIPSDSETCRIYNINSLRNSFHLFLGKRGSVYNKTDIERYESILSKCTNVSDKVKRQHVNRLQKIHKN